MKKDSPLLLSSFKFSESLIYNTFKLFLVKNPNKTDIASVTHSHELHK